MGRSTGYTTSHALPFFHVALAAVVFQGLQAAEEPGWARGQGEWGWL